MISGGFTQLQRRVVGAGTDGQPISKHGRRQARQGGKEGGGAAVAAPPPPAGERAGRLSGGGEMAVESVSGGAGNR